MKLIRGVFCYCYCMSTSMIYTTSSYLLLSSSSSVKTTTAFAFKSLLRRQHHTTTTTSSLLRRQRNNNRILATTETIRTSSATSPTAVKMSTSTDNNVLPSFSANIQQTLDPCVVLMKQMIGQYADLWKDKGGIFSLAQGVVYWTPPAESNQAIVNALSSSSSDLHMYGPDEGLPELRDILRQKVKEENDLSNHDIMVTVGANQAYVNCVLTLLSSSSSSSSSSPDSSSATQQQNNNNNKAVVFAPYYFNHVMALQMTIGDDGLMVGPSSDEGIPDLDWLEQQLKTSENKIQMVTIVNPGNPTGTTLSRDVLQRAVDLCRQYKCWLILDCAYEYFVYDSNDEKVLNFDGCFGTDPHVIHIFSLSKAYALAGYRCGYIAIHNDANNLYEQMLKVQDTIPITPPRISQIAAIGSLQAGRSWVHRQVETLSQGRHAIMKALEPLEHKIMGGTGAMYVMGKLPSRLSQDDEDVARKLVKDYGVAVIPGSYCGFPGWIRVCYANLPPDVCLVAADRLSKGIRTLVK